MKRNPLENNIVNKFVNIFPKNVPKNFSIFFGYGSAKNIYERLQNTILWRNYWKQTMKYGVYKKGLIF